MLLCMRTTLDIGDELRRRAKKRAADEGTSLSHVVEAALRLYLGTKAQGRPYRLRWHAENGRLLPGVRLDDRDALLNLMERR